MTIVEVSGGAAGGGGGGGGAPTPALLLHPGGAVRVYLPAHGEGGAERQVSVRVLDRHTQSYLVHRCTVVKSEGSVCLQLTGFVTTQVRLLRLSVNIRVYFFWNCFIFSFQLSGRLCPDGSGEGSLAGC